MPHRKLISPADLERETGHGKDLLRKWRERYGFPVPARDESGEWGYTKEQIVQLRLILRLQDAGFRPSQIVGKPIEELEQFSKLVAPRECETRAEPVVQQAVGLLKSHQLARLDALLERECGRQSLSDFVIRVAAPLAVAIGNAWSTGEIEVYHEHLCSSILARHLQVASAAKKPKNRGPRIMLGTLSNEHHVLGLLMAQAVFADHGAECINIGSNTPAGEMVAAAVACRADTLAISFSFAYPRRRTLPDLKHLREELPDTVELWAGGSGICGVQRHPKGIRLFADLESAIDAIREKAGT